MSSSRRPRAVAAAALPLVLFACERNPLVPPTSTPSAATASVNAPDRNALAALGDKVFNDVSLSLLGNQSCASCHVEAFGFSSANEAVNAGGSVQPGSIVTRFGSRRTPTAAYASFTPNLEYDGDEQAWNGGVFWDGRATGARLGNAAAEQAQFPFVNPVEMALPDTACVIFRIAKGSYVERYVAAWGPSITRIAFPANSAQLCSTEGSRIPLSTSDRAQISREYDRVGISIAAFENSSAVNQFSSKFDAYLDGEATLTSLELTGMRTFDGKAKCNKCHRDTGRHAFFTDFGYDNLGVPANPLNPALLADPSFKDPGLGATLNDRTLLGAVKAPTLRNVDRRGASGSTKSYMHNGVFKSLEQVVHFYNTRDVLAKCASIPNPQFGVNCWPGPEVEENVNRSTQIGNLHLSDEEERALVAFMRTLSDGYYSPKAPGH
ncbi:MAG: cytochrome c peroxidase [Gemmatimonadaceae bacterium]